jgi:hypothetical protein
LPDVSAETSFTAGSFIAVSTASITGAPISGHLSRHERDTL